MRTGRQDMVCYTPTDGTWNPMTEPLSSAAFKTVRFRIWAAAMETTSGISVSPGIQFSKDGRNWDAAKRLYTLANLVEDRWNDGKSELGWADVDIEAISGVTPRLLLRWGLFGKSSSGLRPFQAELEVVGVDRPNDITLLAPWQVVYGSTTSPDNPVPVTGPLEAARFAEVRLATEYVMGATGTTICKYQAGIQQADDPTNPSDWTWAWTSSNVVDKTSSVIDAATWENFSSAVTKPFFRIAFRGQRNAAGSTVVLGRVRARIELRRVV